VHAEYEYLHFQATRKEYRSATGAQQPSRRRLNRMRHALS
jgi:hypothetical protein